MTVVRADHYRGVIGKVVAQEADELRVHFFEFFDERSRVRAELVHFGVELAQINKTIRSARFLKQAGQLAKKRGVVSITVDARAGHDLARVRAFGERVDYKGMAFDSFAGEFRV